MFFLELSYFLHDPADVGNLISDSSAFSKTSLNIWKFTVHVLLKPGLENFECYFTSMWDETNLDDILKSRDIVNKGLPTQGYGFSSGHVWMWELDYKESWAPKK